MRVRLLFSHTFCLHCFNFPIISPSVYSIFCLFVFPLQCLETLFPFAASLFLPSFPPARSFLPSFLSSFLPSQLSPWRFYSLFPPPCCPPGLPLLPPEAPSLPGEGRRRTCYVQTSLRHTSHLPGDQSQLLHLLLLSVHRYQLCGLPCRGGNT